MQRRVFIDGDEGHAGVNLDDPYEKIADNICWVFLQHGCYFKDNVPPFKLYLQKVETTRPVAFFNDFQILSFSSKPCLESDVVYKIDGVEVDPYDVDAEYHKIIPTE